MIEISSSEQISNKYKTNPNFLLREIGGEYVLIPVGEAGILNNSVISLNETSQFLWEMFMTPSTLEDVIVKAKEAYSAPEGIIEQEVKSFAEAYLEVGLLLKEE